MLRGRAGQAPVSFASRGTELRGNRRGMAERFDASPSACTALMRRMHGAGRGRRQHGTFYFVDESDSVRRHKPWRLLLKRAGSAGGRPGVRPTMWRASSQQLIAMPVRLPLADVGPASGSGGPVMRCRIEYDFAMPLSLASRARAVERQ